MGDDGGNIPSGVFDHYDDEGNPVDKNGLYVNQTIDAGTGPKTLDQILNDIKLGLITAEAAYNAYKQTTQGGYGGNNPFGTPMNNMNTMPSWVVPLGLLAVGVLILKPKSQSKTINGMKNLKGIVDFSGANFKKEALPTITDIAVITGSIIASRKFIDFNKLPATMTAGAFAQGIIKHQGGAKAVLGFLIATTAKHHVLKNVALGIAIDGAIQEARVFFQNADGTNAIPAISGVTTIRNASSNVIGQYRLPDGRILHGAVLPNETVRRSSSSTLAGKTMYRLPDGQILMGTIPAQSGQVFPSQQKNIVEAGDSYGY